MKKSYLSFIFIITLIGSFLFFKYYRSEEPSFDPDGLKESTQGREDNPYAASEFRYNMIAGSKGYIDPQSRTNAIKYTEQYLSRKTLLKGTGISGWSANGPGNIGGRIRAIVIKPSSTNIILIGSVAGGIWKSTNGGSSWLPKLDNGDQLSISSMILDPSNENIVYAGTGEAWGNLDAVYGGGIYKSTDFGETWSLLPSTIGSWEFKNVNQLAMDPSGNLYAITKAYNYKYGKGSYYVNGSLYKSVNGGGSWTNIGNTTGSGNYFNGSDIIPFSSSTIIFAVKENGSTLGGIYKTTNSGTSWTKITSGLPTASYSRISFAKDQNNANTAYAAIHSTNYNASDYGLAGIYKTTDAGSTWNAVTKPSNLTSTGRSYLSTQGWYDNVIAVDPFNSNNIYAAGVDMVKSTNAGSSWNQLTYWHSYYGTPVVHADHHAIAFDPVTANTIYDCNDGGIYKTTNGGSSWTNLNNNLEITQFYGGAVFPTSDIIYGGTQDNGHLKFSSGTSWNQVYGGDGGYAAISQSNSNIAYEEYVYLDIRKTIDGGNTWVNCQTGLTDAASSAASLFIAPFTLNPENDNVLIAGSDKVWVSSTSAATWTQSSNILSSGNQVSAVAISNSGANYLGLAGTTNGKVFKCTNLDPSSGIDTWVDITPAGNNGAWVRRVVVDPSDKQKIYACYSGYNNDGVTPSRHIYYSNDQGGNWVDISGNLPDVPVHSLVIDNNDPQLLYIGTETGIYQSTNRGATWASANTGMPLYVPVDELVRQTGTNKLFAFTHGRGVFVTSAPLPVELASFTNSISGKTVLLKWDTKTELNFSKFEIERAQNKGSFVKIAEISASGNSSSPKDYSYNDKNLSSGSFHYRLKMIDLDGHFKYSGIINADISVPDAYSLEQNYPNPFNPSTKIEVSIPMDGNIKLNIYNVKGELVKTIFEGYKTSGYYTFNINAAELSSGVYLYRLDAGSFSSTKKMVILK